MLNLFAHDSTGVDSLQVVAASPEVIVNWWAILAATAAAMVIGSVWYGPLFGKLWLKLVGLTKKDTENSWKIPMSAMLIGALIQAYVLKHIIAYSAYFDPSRTELSVGLSSAFWVWLGFVLPTLIGAYLFAKRPLKLLKLDLGNNLVTLLVMGAILATLN